MKHNILARIQVYNEEKYIEKWIESVKRFCTHIIALDDGSTDATLEILRKHLPEECIISKERNQHHLESHHHKDMHEKIKELGLNPDWIWCSACDEFFPHFEGDIEWLDDYLTRAKNEGKYSITAHNCELWLSEHWYRIDTKFGAIPFIRFYQYDPDMHWEDDQLVEIAHCKNYPDILDKLPRRKMNQDYMMILHYGYTEVELILRRFAKMAELYEDGRIDLRYIYYNWIRGVDLRDIELKHIPHKWCQGGKCEGCKKPVFTDKTLIPKDHPLYKYWQEFRYKKYIEKLW
jgi:glycosyltransferase involved in cell wall biosynthesis